MPDPQLALSRIADRVKQGGHDIPEEIVIRRYLRGLKNFLMTYQHLTNTWRLYDNSNSVASLIALKVEDEISVVHSELYGQIRNSIDEE